MPEISKRRFHLQNNLYIGGPGNIIDKKLYPSDNFEEYLQLGIESGAVWKDISLTGPLKTELPEDTEKVLNAGAKLPKELWERYFKLLKDIPSPAGINKQ